MSFKDPSCYNSDEGDEEMSVEEILKIVWPLILVQLVFQAYALIDLFMTKKGKTKNFSSTIWAIIIVLGEIVGPAIYFIFGRSEE